MQVLERPQALRGDMVPMNSVIAHDASVIEADFFLQTHSTNPFLSTQTVDSAIAAFLVRARHARVHCSSCADARPRRLRTRRTTRCSASRRSARACTTSWGGR